MIKRTFMIGIPTQFDTYEDWIADHDAKVRADAIDELEKMLEDYKTMGMVSMANVHLFGSRIKEQKNE